MSMNVTIIIIILWCCDDFPNASFYKMHGLMGSCESGGVLYVADLPGTKQLFVQGEQFKAVSKRLFLCV